MASKKTSSSNKDYSINGDEVVSKGKDIFNKTVERKFKVISKDNKTIVEVPVIVVVLLAIFLTPFTVAALLLAILTGHSISITSK